MLFLSVVFVALSLVTLVKGRLFHQIIIDLGEEEIRKNTVDDYRPNKELVAPTIGLIIYGLISLTTYIIYLTNAVGLDPLKYPSLIMLVWYIFGFIIGYMKGKKKMDYTDKSKLNNLRNKLYRRRTFKGTIRSIVTLTYFIYMIYILVF